MINSKRGRWSRVRYFVPAVVLLPLFFGCAATRPPDLSQITPRDIQYKVFENYKKLRTFEGSAQVIIEIPGEGHRGHSNVYINFPDSVFVKTEAILGIDIGSLFLDNSYFGAYAPRDNTLYYGEIESLDLSDFLQVEIKTEELYEVLTGLTQIILDPDSELSIEDNQYFITSRWEDGVVRYWIDPEDFVVTRSEYLDAEDREVLVKEFRRLRKRDGVVLPQLIKVTRPQARERITLYYSRQKINDGIAPGKFALKMDKDARKVYWGNLENPRLER